eukprot:scaffold1410_cov123-Cylindrotheca_fusiformis.AAC.2
MSFVIHCLKYEDANCFVIAKRNGGEPREDAPYVRCERERISLEMKMDPVSLRGEGNTMLPSLYSRWEACVVSQHNRCNGLLAFGLPKAKCRSGERIDSFDTCKLEVQDETLKSRGYYFESAASDPPFQYSNIAGSLYSGYWWDIDLQFCFDGFAFHALETVEYCVCEEAMTMGCEDFSCRRARTSSRPPICNWLFWKWYGPKMERVDHKALFHSCVNFI